MSINIIDTLREVGPEERVKIMQDLYLRNKEFFKKNYPTLSLIINKHQCPYGINMTETFLEIYNEKTGEPAHPPGELGTFAEMMGDWTHNAWVELFNFKVVAPEQCPLHHDPAKEMYSFLMSKFPEVVTRFREKKINLKKLPEGKMFSPPTVFLGIFHGLHIAHYLSRTKLAYALLVEPDVNKFEVSCYFLDYEKMMSDFDVSISVGPDVSTAAIKGFFDSSKISRQSWVRVLPGYIHERNPHFIESFKTFQTSLSNIVFSLDNQYKGLCQSYDHFKRGLPILSKVPNLSKKARICIVATGPSLNNDIEWLKKNKSKCVIFALQSSVRILREAGIKPDFQFSLETTLEENILNESKVFYDVPWVAFVKAPELFAERFKELYLCSLANKASHVKYSVNLTNTAPSTLNLAFSFACHCVPKEIILIGTDLAKPSSGGYHAKGSFANIDGEEDKTAYMDMSKTLVEPAFKESGLLETNPFFSETRFQLENLIKNKKSIKFISFSDGAKIEGTQAIRSNNYKIGVYKHKKKDIATIKSLFIPPKEGVNWAKYEKSGHQFLDDYREELLSILKLDKFSWKQFNKVIDGAIIHADKKVRESEDDFRGDTYFRFIIDLLMIWYNTIILIDDEKTAASIYEVGYQKLRDTLSNLKWPVDN